MQGTRAKDADRDRYVDLIEAAYVDGQLGAEDRELRVTRALSALTLDELEALTRDLQRPPGGAGGRVQVRRASVRAPRAGAVVAVLAALTALVAVGAFALVGLVTGGPGPASPPSDPATSPPTGDAPAPEPFAMTEEDVRAFLEAYEAKFSTLDAYDAGFYPAAVYVEVPVRGSRPRSEDWAWEGAWDQDAEASAVADLYEVMDLGKLDVRRLFINIHAAEQTLRVPGGGELTHVLLSRWAGEPPTVSIYVANTFDESGFIRTTLAGDVVARYPFTS